MAKSFSDGRVPQNEASSPAKPPPLPVKKSAQKKAASPADPGLIQPSAASILAKAVQLQGKRASKKSKTEPEPKPAVKKKLVEAKQSAPEFRENSRPVPPEARERIARASESAAKAGKAMLATAQPASPAVEAGSPSGKRILFITAECSPLAHTGGLGDAVAGLTKALRSRGHDARIVMPLYQSIDRGRFGITYSRSCCVHFGLGEEIWVGIFEGKLDGEVPIWFVDYGRYFDRPYIYDDKEDSYRFGVLSKAALQVCKDTSWIPHVAHVHDWMTSMSAVFLKTWDRVLSPLSDTASVLTIHNIGYQGKFDPAVLPFYGLGGDYMAPDRFEDFGMINLLKAGIQYADAVTTVSPTYAHEIRGPVGGMGMAPYLNNRSEHVFGILNGVDTTVWNPATDKYLPARYNADDLSGKAACKKALQERFGLTVDPHIPLFGIVSRFAPQKGFDLIRGALPQALRDMLMQVVVLGTGEPFTENFFRWLHDAFPKSANAHIGFRPELAHLIEAGSDFFIMPSLYEPCGLNQMYSSLYGTLPLVRATGGLDDTVENYDEGLGSGTGFKFWEISQRALFYTIGWAVSTWFDRPHHYAAMQRQGMTRNFTWDASARQYEHVYEHAMAHRAAL
jgi:starch synthase